MVTTNLDGH
jgi:hypothetical protein